MSEQDRAALIAALAHLGHPFDRKQISKLPATEKRPALDYVNHAHVTNRLNQYAPDWSYTLDEMFTQGGECWVRGTMTILGASRVEFGTGKNPLEATSHFIRRAAMRFGVATDLWAKEDFETSAATPSTSPAADAPGGTRNATNTATARGNQSGATVTAPDAGPEPADLGEGSNGSGPATFDLLANVLRSVDGKTKIAVALINEKNGTRYETWAQAKQEATKAELEKALA
jgi:hypothetical protein